MKRIRVTTILLTSANAALAALVVLLWHQGQARIMEPTRLVTPPLSLPDLAALNSIPMPSVDVSTIRDQAAFYATRAFYRPPAAPVEVPAPEYDMAGTLRLPDGKRIAFVKKRADRTGRTLHLGDDVEGWRVQVIEPDRIILNRNEQTAELRSSPAAGGSGLIRGSGTPRIALTGVRVLGAAGSTAAQIAGQPGPREARTYRPPPPPVGK